MKNVNISELIIPAIKKVRYERFTDRRGYFTETYKRSDFETIFAETGVWQIVQANESYSKPFTIRGLHFQWNPYMGKLVRTINGHMVDLVLDIRKNSPWFGKIIAYDMPASPNKTENEWIWVPPGFAHGNIFLEDTTIEYLCSGEYSPGCEACISPLAEDIDWSLCDRELKRKFEEVRKSKELIITEKDKNGLKFREWSERREADLFEYKKLEEIKNWIT